MNLLPVISGLKIITKDLGVVRLGDVMNYAQIELILEVEKALSSNKPVRIIVLKARQIGMSTIIEAIIFVLAMFIDHLRCLIIAHELDASEHLLGMTTNYWNSFDFKELYTPTNASQKRLGWSETDSRIQITTAKNVRTGRSRTIHALHASEVAFWDDPNTLMTGLRQSIPNSPMTLIFLESTANGLGDYFSSTWDDAVAGKNEYTPLFFPWHRHPEYDADFAGIPYTSPLPPHHDPEQRAEENNLRSMGIGDSRLAWRRWAISNLCEGKVERFHQEYPTTPEEAFLAAGVNIFPLAKLRECYEPIRGTKGRLVREASGRVRFQADVEGPLTIFRRPSDDPDFGIYMVGGDPTRTTFGDPACIQVINRRTWEQVATYRRHIDPNSFAEELMKVADYYNRAMIVPEITGPGYATIGALLQADYPYLWKHQWADKHPGKIGDNFGWEMTNKRKQWMVGNLLKAIIDKDILIHDSETFNEMKNYVTLQDGSYGPNSKDGHDDTVTSLGIALTATITEAHTVPAYGAMQAASVLGQLEEKLEPVWSSWDEEAG